MSNWTWHAKPMGSYIMGSTEGDDNACLIASWLMINFGWTLEAVSGMMGNIAGEGGLNPWQYEIAFTNQLGRIPTESEANSTGYGMGLIGWTPCRKWTDPNSGYWPWDISTFPGYGPNFYDKAGNTNDANAQTELIGRCMQGNGNGNFWIRGRIDVHGVTHNIRAADYILLTDVDVAAVEFLWHAEYPGSIQPPSDPTATENRRKRFAQAWYQHYQDIGFVPSIGKFPFWLILAKKSQEQSNNI